jgi:Flp pilus assembly protein TadD
MKSQFRCILFALLAVPAACGGDRSTSTASSGDTSRVIKPVVTPPETVAKVEPPKVEPPKIEPKVVPAPTTYSETLAQGKAAAASGDRAHARVLFEAASKLDKKAVEPHIELARVFIAMGERHLAITAANKAVKLAPESSHAYNTLGRAELARFNYDDAIAAFHKATELNADNVWAWNNLGFAHLELKRYQEAVDALSEATSRTGAEGYMWNNLGTAYEQLGQLDDARTAFENGGKLGSREALASRKRLEGVKAIVVMKTDKPDVAKPEHGYDLAEPMPVVDSEEPEQIPAAASDAEPVDDEAEESDDAVEPSKPVKPDVAPTAEKPSAPAPL